MLTATAPALRKRTFTTPTLARSLTRTVASGPVLLRALRRPAVSPALREEVMLAVTEVNDCRYCSWVHTGAALRAGADLDALESTLSGSLDDPTASREQVAVLYAQHVASTAGRVDPEAVAALNAAWGRRERAEIRAYIALISFSNLTGNSADAWLLRLRGQRGSDGSPVAEAIAALLGAPVLLFIYARSRGFRRASKVAG